MKIVNVIGYEGIYAVLDNGEIYNIKRGHKLKTRIEKSGYESVVLTKNGERKTHKVHQIVYRSFNGKEGKLEIDHIDSNRANNTLANLRAITKRENVARAKHNIYGRGVHYYKSINKFGAEIMIEGEKFYLGVFSSVEDARNAYIIARDNWEKLGIKPQKRDRSKKKCGGCGLEKDINEFYYVKNHGYSYLCKECHKEEMRRKNLKYKLNNIGNGKVFK